MQPVSERSLCVDSLLKLREISRACAHQLLEHDLNYDVALTVCSHQRLAFFPRAPLAQSECYSPTLQAGYWLIRGRMNSPPSIRSYSAVEEH
jgi:hypothetical protein